MNEKERRAIVWDKIEHLAFRPNMGGTIENWLSVYAKNLHTFWGLEPKWIKYGVKDSFDIPFLDLRCDYNIVSLEKYSAALSNISENLSYWQNEIDPKYLSKASLHSANGIYPKEYKKKILVDDIEATLDGMIFHPRCHAHIENTGVRYVQLDKSKDGLSTHEVRIGGGIENPCVFLFHLRYQFCLVSKDAFD